MKTYLPIAAVFLAVILSGVLSFHELTVLRDDNAVVSHSYEIQQQLVSLLSELKDAEAGQRGYLYTNNAELPSAVQRLANRGGLHLLPSSRSDQR